ncbi:hypothetical protein [Flavisolibacter tropicus]|uniref:Uncharacterized protein n=1 Tax=Flavisolibacter tropicus TaxID=1492898 RepID=A0A172TUJ9_9BACT|nr:hypothetical protein [Flavisolibacter tropicus]ANE50672.1 hypothetical protein SY85_09315 [Flavisolibacter tropicus]
MNKKIKTYEDLEEEKLRLLSLLKTQESTIRTDIAGLKENLKPLGAAMDTINKLTTRDNRVPVLNIGLEMGIDLLMRKLLLSKAGWFTKIIIPFVVKNYTSHILGEEKREFIIKKLKNLFKKMRPSSQPRPDPMATDQ